jgi:hypothetical protein
LRPHELEPSIVTDKLVAVRVDSVIEVFKSLISKAAHSIDSINYFDHPVGSCFAQLLSNVSKTKAEGKLVLRNGNVLK